MQGSEWLAMLLVMLSLITYMAMQRDCDNGDDLACLTIERSE